MPTVIYWSILTTMLDPTFDPTTGLPAPVITSDLVDPSNTSGSSMEAVALTSSLTLYPTYAYGGSTEQYRFHSGEGGIQRSGAGTPASVFRATYLAPNATPPTSGKVTYFVSNPKSGGTEDAIMAVIREAEREAAAWYQHDRVLSVEWLYDFDFDDT